MISNSNQ